MQYNESSITPKSVVAVLEITNDLLFTCHATVFEIDCFQAIVISDNFVF